MGDVPGVLLLGVASGIVRSFPAGVCGSEYCFAQLLSCYSNQSEILVFML